MANPIGGIFRRLAKWLVKKGLDELDHELEKQRGAAPTAGDSGNSPVTPMRSSDR